MRPICPKLEGQKRDIKVWTCYARLPLWTVERNSPLLRVLHHILRYTSQLTQLCFSRACLFLSVDYQHKVLTV